ncbi:MAG: hypothetical protein NXI32_24455 [bacterium]|nr:hypothetical protein [bacterium]
MKRISHDLPGVSQRIAKLADALELEVEETKSVWKDEKGRNFLRQHYSEVRPAISQLVSGLSESVELFEQIAKRLQDPENY